MLKALAVLAALVGAALSLLSLAGIPPLAGFVGKVLLLAAAISGGMTWLAVVAVLNMALALYYYVAVIAEMYLKPPAREEQLPGSAGYTLAAGLSLGGTFALTILAGHRADATNRQSAVMIGSRMY